jgi:hypothetical protein
MLVVILWCHLVSPTKLRPTLLVCTAKNQLESNLPNFDFVVFLIFAIKLGHFNVLTIFSYATNNQG